MPSPKPSHTHTTEIQLPPGQIVAPNGFPTDPRPVNAPKTFNDSMDIRLAVFCDEQQCSVINELDEDDPRSWSWVVYQRTPNSSISGLGEPVSTLRMVPPPHGRHPNGYFNPEEEPYIKLTRVATMPHARGQGISRRLIEEAFSWLAEHPEAVGNEWNGLVLTHAQVAVEKMYTRMGFVTDEKLGVWDEEGIDHIGMWRKIELKAKT